MTGSIPGVPHLHLTYVHMTVAALMSVPFILAGLQIWLTRRFVLMWNQLANEVPPAAPDARPSSSSSSSSREKPRESSSKSEKKEDKPPDRPSPWEDLRAHPSAFLTTRLNRAAMWPFPMGKAGKTGPELWWESGTPSHVYVSCYSADCVGADETGATSTSQRYRLSRKRKSPSPVRRTRTEIKRRPGPRRRRSSRRQKKPKKLKS